MQIQVQVKVPLLFPSCRLRYMFYSSNEFSTTIARHISSRQFTDDPPRVAQLTVGKHNDGCLFFLKTADSGLEPGAAIASVADNPIAAACSNEPAESALRVRAVCLWQWSFHSFQCGRIQNLACR